MYDQDDLSEDSVPSKRPLLLRVIAFITAFIFLALVVITSWSAIRQPLTELVSNSFRLKKSIGQELLQAVVQIDVISRKEGTSITASQSKGSGFNINPTGEIITNHHVISGALNITVTFPDGKIFRAERWSSRPEFDLAVIYLGVEKLPVVSVNTLDPPVTGDSIMVVGNPLSLNNIVVEGKVLQYMKLKNGPDPIFSIDAPIYPGNSGSPVFNKDGMVVGVVFGTLHFVEEGQDKITGLAVPISAIMNLREDT